ncbi:MAG: uracil-DNA glycosylase family protein [Sphingobacterium sp.]
MKNDQTIAEQMIRFNRDLDFIGSLPEGYAVINPFLGDQTTLAVMETFYRRFYDDVRPRKFVVGINPSRHGAGITGVPFTDTKRMESQCGIPVPGKHSHELSSVFMYDMMQAYGGVEAFYSRCFINSPFPLALIRQSSQGKWVNVNYYDKRSLFEILKPHMKTYLRKLSEFHLDRSHVIVLGKKNAIFLQEINEEIQLFDRMTILEHPRFIQQYHSRERDTYILKYLRAIDQ